MIRVIVNFVGFIRLSETVETGHVGPYAMQDIYGSFDSKPCDEVLGAAQCTWLETSFMSTNVKPRKRLRYDLLLTVI